MERHLFDLLVALFRLLGILGLLATGWFRLRLGFRLLFELLCGLFQLIAAFKTAYRNHVLCYLLLVISKLGIVE